MGIFDEVLNNVGEPHKSFKGFTAGTHEVIIGEAEATTKDTQKMKDAPIIKVVVFDELDNDRTATCTLWFHTEGAAKMSVAKVLGLLVHNVGEDKKEAVRDLGKKLFGGISDPTKAQEVAAKLIGDKLIGKKGYLVAEPQGDYDTTAYGDLWHYPADPSKKKEPETVELADGTVGEVVDASEIPNFDEV